MMVKPSFVPSVASISPMSKSSVSASSTNLHSACDSLGSNRLSARRFAVPAGKGRMGIPVLRSSVAHRSDGSIAAARYHEVVFGGILEQWRKFGIRPERADGNGVALFGVAAHEVIYPRVAEARA